MSIDEKITQNLAFTLSRRNFLKAAGVLVTSLGMALAGKVDLAEAGPACCPNPECSGCQGAGSICPSGYAKTGQIECCLNGCKWTCNQCHNNSYPYNYCFCSHNDLTNCIGDICGDAPAP